MYPHGSLQYVTSVKWSKIRLNNISEQRVISRFLFFFILRPEGLLLLHDLSLFEIHTLLLDLKAQAQYGFFPFNFPFRQYDFIYSWMYYHLYLLFFAFSVVILIQDLSKEDLSSSRSTLSFFFRGSGQEPQIRRPSLLPAGTPARMPLITNLRRGIKWQEPKRRRRRSGEAAPLPWCLFWWEPSIIGPTQEGQGPFGQSVPGSPNRGTGPYNQL